MIIYKGIKPTSGKFSLLMFSNKDGQVVEIPVENSVANYISKHLEKIGTPFVDPSESNNIDEND